jgi:hypothetical protein
MEAAAFALGVFLLALTTWDLFETVVVPRPTPGWFRIGRYVVRGSWRVLLAIRDGRSGRSFDNVLGLFAPAVTLGLLAAWLIGLILGYGLILYALRDELRPVPPDLGSALYFAASSVLTLGFGDIVADGSAARLIVTVAAITGLGTVALVVTFLFSLYGSYQRREIQVVALQAAAGAPPSAVALLESYAHLGLVGRLPDLFLDWQRWGAEVLDSHVAYPLLGYFRSSHDDLSWISAVGTMLDAASLVLTTIEDVPRGEAKLFKRVGTHLVEDNHNLGFRAGRDMACIPGGPRDLRAAARGHGALLGYPRNLMARRPGRPPAADAPHGRSIAHRDEVRQARGSCVDRHDRHEAIVTASALGLERVIAHRSGPPFLGRIAPREIA